MPTAVGLLRATYEIKPRSARLCLLNFSARDWTQKNGLAEASPNLPLLIQFCFELVMICLKFFSWHRHQLQYQLQCPLSHTSWSLRSRLASCCYLRFPPLPLYLVHISSLESAAVKALQFVRLIQAPITNSRSLPVPLGAVLIQFHFKLVVLLKCFLYCVSAGIADYSITFFMLYQT